ncbi:MAG: PQQ-binding-like beta-propeller repeat protein [Pirellulaceae bacterium]
MQEAVPMERLLYHVLRAFAREIKNFPAREPNTMFFKAVPLAFVVFALAAASLCPKCHAQPGDGATEQVAKARSGMEVGVKDSPELMASSLRNAVVESDKIPDTFDLGSSENVLWTADLGSETYGSPVVANGKIYVGTNNENGYLDRFPAEVDLGVLLCFDESDGKFLWQHSSEKLEEGRYVDWPQQGVCSNAFVDGERLWFVNNRAEVICLDTEGFLDGENDGAKEEANENKDEADVIWKLDMRKDLGVRQLYMATCSITGAGDKIFICTSNGCSADGEVLAPEAPSFLCLDRNTGDVLWQDNAPGKNILHGQWSSPAYAELAGKKQVIFGAGDGWVYSFDADGENGKSKLLWKFDCNPKAAEYVHGGGGDRFYAVGTPVIYNGLVYMATGDDPEFCDGKGHLWCIDPSKTGDVSPTLVTNPKYPDQVIPNRRYLAFVPDEGDVETENPNSAAVWHYVGANPAEFETTMHPSIGSPAIKDDLLFITDFSGMLHCLNAKTGEAYWTYDMFAAVWGSPVIVGNKVLASNEDGDIAVFALSKEQKLIDKPNVENSMNTSPVVANDTLYVTARSKLLAIQKK